MCIFGYLLDLATHCCNFRDYNFPYFCCSLFTLLSGWDVLLFPLCFVYVTFRLSSYNLRHLHVFIFVCLFALSLDESILVYLTLCLSFPFLITGFIFYVFPHLCFYFSTLTLFMHFHFNAVPYSCHSLFAFVRIFMLIPFLHAVSCLLNFIFIPFLAYAIACLRNLIFISFLPYACPFLRNVISIPFLIYAYYCLRHFIFIQFLVLFLRAPIHTNASKT